MRFHLELTYQRARDQFLILDPGLFRLRMAIRGTLAVGASFITLWKLSEFSHHSMILGFVGVMMAQLGVLAVNDRTIREQKETSLLIPLAASLALTLGVLVSPSIFLTVTFLLVMTYLAIDLRRYGPRGAGIGLMSYFAFFASIFFKVPLESIAFVILGIFIAGTFSFIIRFYLIPDVGESTIAWSLAAYRAGLRRFIRATDREVQTTRASGINRDRLRRRMARVNDLALLSEDSIVNSSDAIPGSGALARALQGKVFDLELSARKVFESLTERSAQEIRSDLLKLAEDINVLRSGQQAFVAEEEAASASGTNTRVQDISAKIVSVGGLNFNTRQAIQASLATALATLIGMSVSQERWYWASVAAYVVFAGTTRGDNLRRAAQRLFGTLAGIFAGIGLGTLLSGHRDLEIAMIFVAVFLGLHAARAAYSWLTFWFTLVVALFYSLLGQLTNEIMFLRLEQTVIGAACGAVMAMLILPVSTRATLRLEFAKLLRIMSAIIQDAIQIHLPRRERRQRVRVLERELSTLRGVAGPLSWPMAGTGRSETRLMVHSSSLITHFTRHLVVFFPDDADAEMKSQCLALCERADALALKLEENTEFSERDVSMSAWTETETAPGKDVVTYALTRLTQALNAIELRLANTK